MSLALRAHLLGGFRVEADGEVIQLSGSRTARSLLAYLLLSPDRQHLRSKLAGMYWPEQPEPVARERLRSALWRIGRSFESTGVQVLEQAREWISIGPDVDVWVDVTEFRQLAGEAGRGSADVGDLLQRAVELYEGEFMPGHYEDWVFEEQESLKSVQVGALARLLAIRESDGQFDRALLVAKRMVAIDHLNEAAHRDVMRLCAVLRRPEEALRQYREIRRALKYELSAEPAGATAQLAADIASHVQASLPSPPTSDRSQAPVFVARQAERDLLIGTLERALGIEGAIGLIEGPPGVGKSSLLEQAGEDAKWRNFEILRGSYQDRVAGEAFEGIRGAIDGALTSLRIEQLRSICEPMWLQEASRVIPRLGMSADPSVRLTGEDSRWKVQESLVQVLKALASIYPTMLILEDVHWADLDSLAVLKQLATAMEGVPLVVLVSYRREEAEADLDRWDLLQDLDRSPFTKRVVLGDLDVDAVSRLVDAIGGFGDHTDQLARWLVEQTGGNPLFVVETLKSLREDDPSHPFTLPQALPVAASVAEIVEHRLDKLDEVARQVIDAAAVFARPVSAAQLAELTDLDYAAVLDNVTGVVRRQVLSDQPDGLLFSHELIRRVAYDGIHPNQLHDLHVRSAEVLMELAAAPAEIAHHLHEAQEWEDAATWSTRAAESAEALSAYDTARTHYKRALEAAGSVGTGGADLFGLLGAAERVADILGDRDQQVLLLDRMDELAGGNGHRAEFQLRRAWYLAHTDQFAEAEQAAVAGRDLAPDRIEDFGTVLAQIHVWSGQPAGAVSTLGAVIEMLGDSAGARTHLLLGTAYAEAGRLEDSESELNLAVQRFRREADRAGEARSTGVLGTVIAERGRIVEAEKALREGQLLAREIGYRIAEAECTVNLATVFYMQNSSVDALREYRLGESAFLSIGQQRGVASVRMNRASLELYVVGSTQSAVDAAVGALAYFEAVGDVVRVELCRSIIAAAALETSPDGSVGDYRGCVERLLASDGRSTAQGVLLAFLGILLERDDIEIAALYFPEVYRLASGPDRYHEEQLMFAWEAKSSGEAAQAERILDAMLADLDDQVRYGPTIAWRSFLLADPAGPIAQRAIDLAAGLLSEILDSLDGEDLELALSFPRHALILAEHRRRSVQTRTMEIPAKSAPGGRSPRPDELVAVSLTIAHPDDRLIDNDAERRRHRVNRIVSEASDQGATAGVKHLASALDVSQATIKRDLAALRLDGTEIRTRGSQR